MDVLALTQVVTHLTEENRRLEEENAKLRAQLDGDGAVYVMRKPSQKYRFSDIFDGGEKVCLTLDEVHATVAAFGAKFPDQARAQRMIDHARASVTSDKNSSDVIVPETVGPGIFVCTVERHPRV